MKIELPHRTLRLTEEQKMLSDEEKVQLVNEILQEEFVLEGNKTTLETYLYNSFDNPASIVIMDMLAYFITKIHRKRQDLMTRETIRKMKHGDGRTFNFSSLNYTDRSNMGLIDDVDDYDFN